MKPETTIAVLGTGLMGAPVARNLNKHGFAVRAWNRTKSKADTLVSDGIQVFETSADAVRGADIIVTVLKDGPSVTEAMQAAAPSLSKGTIWVQLSTIGPQAVATQAAFAARYGLVFYDAAMQGTPQPAEQGQLIILAAGPLEARSAIQPVFDAIGKRTVWVSEEIGSASRLKLALNSWVFVLTHGMAESLRIAKGLGVDPALVVDVVTGGPMDCAYFQLKSSTILKDDYTVSFSIANAVKDSLLITEAAAGAGVQADLAQAGLKRFQRVLEGGHGDKDLTASYLA